MVMNNEGMLTYLWVGVPFIAILAIMDYNAKLGNANLITLISDIKGLLF